MAEINNIRDNYFREGLNISEISRKNNVDRKTARKYIMNDDWNNEPEIPSGRCSKLDAYKPQIDSWLEEDCKRRRKQRHSAKRIFDRLKFESDNFDCPYRTVAAYVSTRKK